MNVPEMNDLSDFFNRMPVAFYRTYPDGSLIASNPALAEILGYDTVESLNNTIGSVESVYMDPGLRRQWLERMAAQGVVHDFDVELTRPDGSTIWVRDSARAIRGEDGEIKYYEGSLIDVTDKFQAQRDKDEFVATVSHELRNPLAAMLGLGRELADNYDSFTDEDRREMAQVIARQADDASWLIEDLLVAYRNDLSQVSISMEEFDATKEVERVLEAVNAPIELQVVETSPMALADPRRTRQVLRNLVSNALRYGMAPYQISMIKVGDRVEIRVQDAGDAIPDAEVERIFRSFERGGQPHHPKSVGLGLSVARQLARLMDGDLTYRHQDRWSSFVLSLPSA